MAVERGEPIRTTSICWYVFPCKIKYVDLWTCSSNLIKLFQKWPQDMEDVVVGDVREEKNHIETHHYILGIQVQVTGGFTKSAEFLTCFFSHVINMKEKLDLSAQTAESLAKGDIIQRIIRKDNAWKLLPTQAIFSSVLPGSLMEGHLTAQIDFPAYLGKTSTKGKMERLIQEVTLHSKTTTRATKESMKQDYLSYLRDAIVKPLVDESRGKLATGEGVHNAIEVMHGYSLLREDLDSILELTHFPGSADPMSSVHTKVKSAFTRAYNKEGMLTPYSVTMNVKKKRGAVTDDYGSELEEEEDEEDEGDPLADAMIKVKKATKTSNRGHGRGSRGGGSNSEDGGRRGRGRGKRGK
ncbi:hypothetical protein J437_LFUL011668 [Ladona fulva]|uniref:DNA replication factor RFC1 C-terminal domain-containing protein n=1 Tax=Ladona fulva TaxID=123851 RepID=A0A8K0KEH8_LADFU|nr:hypothetical protein J437_LFUL011668 [Ladona fulva]